MSHHVGDAYDSVAEQYAELFLHGLDDDAQSRRWLDRFTVLAERFGRPVVDVGCGPGGVVHHLGELGLAAIGTDMSPGQIAQAQAAFPDLTFHIGDLTELPYPDGSLGGLVSKYSIIHLSPTDLPSVFLGWRRVLAPGAPVFVSFFGSRSADAHASPFDHTVATAYALWPESVGSLLEAAGYVDVEIEANPIPEGGRPFDHATILAHTPTG